MPTNFIAELKREMRMPNVREAFLVLVLAFAVGIVLALLQALARPLIEARFALDSVSFPLALRPVERAGSIWNLVGWGYLLNEHHIESVPRWVFDKALTLLIVMVFSRLLWWGPLISQAGAMANLLEWHLTGHVLDWIIFPDGAFGVRALSLGDIAIYGGVALTVSALALMCARMLLKWCAAFREVTRAVRARH